MTPGIAARLPMPPVRMPAGMDGVPLRASGIVEAFDRALEQFIGSKIDQSIFMSMRYALSDILRFQSGIRGLDRPTRELWSNLVIELDVGCNLVVRYGSSWADDVDRHLGNHDCERCGGLRTHGFAHTRDDCDLILAGDVLES